MAQLYRSALINTDNLSSGVVKEGHYYEVKGSMFPRKRVWWSSPRTDELRLKLKMVNIENVRAVFRDERTKLAPHTWERLINPSGGV